MALSRTRKRSCLLGGVALGAPLLLCCCGFMMLTGGVQAEAEFLGYLFVGWVPYIGRGLPDVRVGWLGVALGLAVLVAAPFVVHLVRRRRWGAEGLRWGDSLRFAGVGVLAVGAGFALAGLCREVVRLQTGPDPVFYDRMSDPRNHQVRRLGRALAGDAAWRGGPPPALVQDASGRALHGWPTLLLPHLGHEELFRRIDLAEPWDAPRNFGIAQTGVASYLPFPDLPAEDDKGRGLNYYAGNARVLGGDRQVRLKDLARDRGTSRTIVLGEVSTNVRPWASPVHWRDLGHGLGRHPDGFGAPEKGATYFLLADGSVRRLARDTDPKVLQALAGPKVEAKGWDR